MAIFIKEEKLDFSMLELGFPSEAYDLEQALHPDIAREPSRGRGCLEQSRAERSALFEAIPNRQSTRTIYDGRPVANQDLRLLEQAGTAVGVSVRIMTERAQIANLGDYVIRGNSAQMNDKAFMDELLAWLRFNETEAVATMDGLFSRASGRPSVPRWLAQILMKYVIIAS